MRFTSVVTILALTGAIAASTLPNEDMSELLDARNVQAGCKDNGCACYKGSNQARYCGWCLEVKDKGKGGEYGDVSDY